MLENKEGQAVPAVVFHTRENNDWLDVSTETIFAQKKVIVFALPGAFTPTCSSTHLPRYNELSAVFREHGIDDIICLSVNDAFVMDAWKENQDAANIRFIPDGNGAFSEGMGMLVNKNDLGFGDRSWRYSMLVNDGVIEKMFIEPDVPGDPFQVSDADTMLQHVAPNAIQPPRITLFSKAGCSHCSRAKQVLSSKGLGYEEIQLGVNGVSYSSLVAVSGAGTTPQVFVNGESIGGADELEHWLGEMG
ncbi:glutathione peroxidase [Gammaproteobacteria bacterium 42_54_T18]|nr:glutathione peroxidase [Gammaproteobacteria bacterium 42_54_T18]